MSAPPHAAPESSADLPEAPGAAAPSEPSRHWPPFWHTDLPAVGGQIGPEPADFRVEELPLYEASGVGDHRYVKVQKERATTAALVAAVARQAGVEARSVGYAGLKDKWAVTAQWLSVPASGRPPEQWSLEPEFSVLAHTLHGNKLRLGHLSGNRFTIRLMGASAGALGRAQALLERLSEQGFGNYFGRQRFGMDNDNLERTLHALKRGRFGRMPPQKRKFMASVVQSEVFNRFLTERRALGLDRLLEGDVVRLEGARSVFVVEDCAAEQARLEAGDVHLTGPMVGPKARQAGGGVHALELRCSAELGLDDSALAALGRAAPGTRRDLLVRPQAPSVHAEEGALVLGFALPSGSYATELIRVLTRSEEPRQRTPAA